MTIVDKVHEMIEDLEEEIEALNLLPETGERNEKIQVKIKELEKWKIGGVNNLNLFGIL